MPDIFVIVSSYETLSSDPSKCRVEGRSSAAGRTVGDIGWSCNVNFSDNTTQLNAAFIAAAIAEWSIATPPVTVTGGDKKVLLCAAT